MKSGKIHFLELPALLSINGGPISLLWALELGSISLIGMLDAALALTPSASMLNSSLAHQHRQKSWGGLGDCERMPFPPDLKTELW